MEYRCGRCWSNLKGDQERMNRVRSQTGGEERVNHVGGGGESSRSMPFIIPRSSP